MKNKLIILAIAVIAVGGVGAYFLKNKDSGGGPLGGIAVLPGMQNYECRYNDADLCRFMMGWKEVKEYTMKSSSYMKGEISSESIFEIDGDRSRIVATSEGREVMAVVNIGEVNYMKDLTDGKWWKTEPEKNTVQPSVIPDESEFDFDFDKKMDAPEDKTAYNKLGKEACGSKQCFKYEVVDPQNTDTKEFLWFDDSEYQLYKTRSESTGADAMVSEMVMTYGSVEVTEPSPVKEGSMMDAAMKNSGMSEKDMQAFQKQMEESQMQGQNMPSTSDMEIRTDEPYMGEGGE